MTGGPARRSPLAWGFIAAGVLLLAVALLRDRGRAGEDDAAVPAITLVAPREGDTVSGPLRIRFRSSVPLESGPMGWTAAGLHPHVLLDGREHMAAASDIVPADDGYVWTLAAPARGPHTLLLAWAGADHRVRGDTARRTLRFFAR